MWQWGTSAEHRKDIAKAVLSTERSALLSERQARKLASACTTTFMLASKKQLGDAAIYSQQASTFLHVLLICMLVPELFLRPSVRPSVRLCVCWVTDPRKL